MSLQQSLLSTRHYIKQLFDHVQSHAIYGVDDDEVVQVKELLKSYGATRFRVVKIRKSNLRIVCYKAKK